MKHSNKNLLRAIIEKLPDDEREKYKNHLQMKIGLRFYHENGVDRNPHIAALWLCRAANAGCARAMFNLAMMKLIGDGVERCPERARALLRDALDKGYSKAAKFLDWLDQNPEWEKKFCADMDDDRE